MIIVIIFLMKRWIYKVSPSYSFLNPTVASSDVVFSPTTRNQTFGLKQD